MAASHPYRSMVQKQHQNSYLRHIEEVTSEMERSSNNRVNSVGSGMVHSSD